MKGNMVANVLSIHPLLTEENFENVGWEIEEICIKMCRVDNVDPNKESIGMGVYIKEGVKHKMWHTRIPYALAILEP